MKFISALLCSICFFISCSEEITEPSFPEINNPLNQISILQSTFDKAVDIADLFISTDQNINTYKDKNGALYSGWVKKSYPNGNVGFLFKCENGLQNGLHTAWHENGKKMVERTWEDGQRSGPFKNWSPSGVLESRGYNQNNLLNGLLEEFYFNGVKKSEIVYVNGKIDSFEKWQPDGMKCPNSLVRQGTGIVFHYTTDGMVESNQSFYMGNIDYGRPVEFNQSSPLNGDN